MGSELVPENARSLIVGWGKKFLMHQSSFSELFIAANSASLACKAARQVELSLRAKEMHFCTGSTGQENKE